MNLSTGEGHSRSDKEDADLAEDFSAPNLSDGEAYWSSSSSSTQSEGQTWISWWCSHAGHEYFAEIPEDFIEDDFNMTGLSSVVPYYKEALELILDIEPESDEGGSEEEMGRTAPDQAIIEKSAELLYGLIHQRFITSRVGLIAMQEKFDQGHFGHCPRVYCQGTPVLPIGQSDLVGAHAVKLFCSTCIDIYTPPNSRFHVVDGAFFGTTFPHLFFQTFPASRPLVKQQIFNARIYGFKVNERAKSGHRMEWLRHYLADNISDSDDEDSAVRDDLLDEDDKNGKDDPAQQTVLNETATAHSQKAASSNNHGMVSEENGHPMQSQANWVALTA